jgi:oligopeptide/dipeptide ABC transporter ATP-binding protein
MLSAPVLEIEDLSIRFSTRQGTARVVERLSFSLQSGETLGIVGESGCGKSITALAIMGLIPMPPGQVSGGEIRFAGRNLLAFDAGEMRRIRGREIAMVFQEPMTALNPVYTAGEQIGEVLRTHAGLDRHEAFMRTVELLCMVGIPDPERRAAAYPHQLSGGMRQRVMIAMALACEPKLLICDEPTTALDVSVQAQILDLLRELRERLGTAIIMITHDMGVVAEMADRVLVMYAGRKVEEGPAREIIRRPLHPYTRALIGCLPKLDGAGLTAQAPLPEIPGTVPALTGLGPGCVFNSRCGLAEPRCQGAMPPLGGTEPGHLAACWVTVRSAS